MSLRRSTRLLAVKSSQTPDEIEAEENTSSGIKRENIGANGVGLGQKIELSDSLVVHGSSGGSDYSESGYIIGVDEAGRGPLAGPVVIAACYIPADIYHKFDGARDSKEMSVEERERLYDLLVNDKNVRYSIVEKSHEVIDEINILEASLLGMFETASSIIATSFAASISGDNRNKKLIQVKVDGNHIPKQFKNYLESRASDAAKVAVEAVIKGDSKVFAISCASILAKVHRDNIMQKLHELYPVYGFDVHKGYPTLAHRNALKLHGACEIHRKSYAPVKAVLELQNKIIKRDSKLEIDIMHNPRRTKRQRKKS